MSMTKEEAQEATGIVGQTRRDQEDRDVKAHDDRIGKRADELFEAAVESVDEQIGNAIDSEHHETGDGGHG